MSNFFSGFKQFCEQDTKFTNTMSSRLGVTNTDQMFMPITIPAGSKFGKYKFRQPTVMYVVDSTEESVTLSNVPVRGTEFDDGWNNDGKLELDPGTPREKQEFSMSKREFQKLLEPQSQPQDQPMF